MMYTTAAMLSSNTLFRRVVVPRSGGTRGGGGGGRRVIHHIIPVVVMAQQQHYYKSKTTTTVQLRCCSSASKQQYHRGDGSRKQTNNVLSFFFQIPTTSTRHHHHHSAAAAAVTSAVMIHHNHQQQQFHHNSRRLLSNKNYFVDDNKVGGDDDDGTTAIVSTQKQQQQQRQQPQNTILHKEEEKKQFLLTKKKKKTSYRTWEDSFKLLILYKEKYGNCNVPQNYKDDPRLGRWVMRQRNRRSKRKTNKKKQEEEKKDSMSHHLKEEDYRIRKLDEIGFLWNKNEITLLEEQQQQQQWNTKEKEKTTTTTSRRLSWDENFQLLMKYAERNNGDCNIPSNTNTTTNNNDHHNRSLWMWVRDQRKRKILLSKEQRSKLDQLGFIWENSNQIKANQKWNTMYQRLLHYKSIHGDCLVPQTYKVVEVEVDTNKDRRSLPLGIWVYHQRQNYRKGLLRYDRKQQLESINFIWKVKNSNYQPNYKELDKQWYIQYEKLIVVWTKQQQQQQQNNHHHHHQKRLFDTTIPFNYNDKTNTEEGEEVAETETLSSSSSSSLNRWIHQQRVQYKNGTLRSTRIQWLNSIQFIWDLKQVRERQWMDMYNELVHFKNIHGHLQLPRGKTQSKLSNWVSRQRVKILSASPEKMDSKKVTLLKNIGLKFERK